MHMMQMHFWGILASIWEVFWSSFSQLFGRFSNLLQHFMICSSFGEQNCLNLLSMVGWKRSRGILASILGGTLLETG